MHPMLNTAIKAARSAGNLILRNLSRIDSLSVSTKQRHDFVSEVDRQAEREIIKILKRAYPDHTILAEESGLQQTDSEFTWIIDPLDGTTNYLHGFPHYAVSIALKRQQVLDQAVIYDPLKNELFTATKGAGAQLDNHRIRVSPRAKLDGALLGTGFPFRMKQHLDTYLEMFRVLFEDAAGVRRAGSAALDLAYVASGRLDGFWEMGLSPWDMAAGVLLIKEAGGLVCDFNGRQDYLDSGHIVAGTPRVCAAIQRKIVPFIPAEFKKESPHNAV